MRGGAFGDGARASADEATDASATLGAVDEGGVGHLLALLETARTGITSIFVGRHGFVSWIHCKEVNFRRPVPGSLNA